MGSPTVSYFRQISEDRTEEFLRKGYKKRHFFPHKIYYLRKCGPDGFKLANWMRGQCNLDQLWEIVIYADSPVIDEFPQALFFDDDVVWHQQQFGKSGQVASANLVRAGDNLYSMVHISDLVQRISRRREFKTRIENRFKGWSHILLNSILNFAIENDIVTIHSPVSDWALTNTDPKRTVQKELFERVYDRSLHRNFVARREGNWWTWSVAENRDRAVIAEPRQELFQNGKIVCVCHDIEGGFGHVETDADFAALADKTSPHNLRQMLRIENELGVKATYNVLGCLMKEVRATIEADGHCVAFHSYDHKINTDQLPSCREIDYRIKGYRPPQSKITAELTDANLCFHNFEWLASSTHSLGISSPIMGNRIVKIPIRFDDFDLYKGKVDFERWSREAINIINDSDFVAFCLHDCYGSFWLPHYKDFLGQIVQCGKLKTLNEVSNEVILAHSV